MGRSQNRPIGGQLLEAGLALTISQKVLKVIRFYGSDRRFR